MLHFMTYEFRYEFMYIKTIVKSYLKIRVKSWFQMLILTAVLVIAPRLIRNRLMGALYML